MNKPHILFEGKFHVQDLNKLKKSARQVRDVLAGQLAEYYEITHPHLRLEGGFQKKVKGFVKKYMGDKGELRGNWVYFPWNQTLVHCIGEQAYWQLRTNRNQEIISADEQKKLYSFTPAILGLSIGGNMAVDLAYSGIGNRIKLADFDVISSTNLNRLRVPLFSVGEAKIDIVSRKIYEINPYAKLEIFEKGVSVSNLDKFVNKSPKSNVIVDAIDDFKIKVLVRLAAQKAKIPLVMLTNLGDNILIDVERYDTDKGTRPFNGLVPSSTLKEIVEQPLTEALKQKFAAEIVGIKNIPARALVSLKQINKTLTGRPQIMSTVSVGAGLASLVCREIALGRPLKSGRKLIALNEVAFNK